MSIIYPCIQYSQTFFCKKRALFCIHEKTPQPLQFKGLSHLKKNIFQTKIQIVFPFYYIAVLIALLIIFFHSKHTISERTEQDGELYY